MGIENIILKKGNIILIGETNSGKSFFVKNKLVPFLEKKGINSVYFKNCDELNPKEEADIFIVDEVEILFDKTFLEHYHPEEKPFYTETYLQKVKKRHDKLSRIRSQIICIVTRNDKKEINYIYQNYKKLEWNNLPVTVVKFIRDKIILIDNVQEK